MNKEIFDLCTNQQMFISGGCMSLWVYSQSQYLVHQAKSCGPLTHYRNTRLLERSIIYAWSCTIFFIRTYMYNHLAFTSAYQVMDSARFYCAIWELKKKARVLDNYPDITFNVWYFSIIKLAMPIGMWSLFVHYYYVRLFEMARCQRFTSAILLQCECKGY